MANFTRLRPDMRANKARRWVGLLVLCMMFFVGQTHHAQTTVSLGTYSGAGSTNVLLSTSTTSNNYSRTISLYTSSEILLAGGMPGNITSLAWDKNGTGEYTSADAYIKIYLKHVTNEIWDSVPEWSAEVIGATEVFTSSTYSIPIGTGWKEVNFTTPFEWNGVNNVAVFVEWHRLSAPTGDITWGRSTTTTANATRVGSTSLDALVMLINSNRPLLQLTIMPSGPITCPIPTTLAINNITSDTAELSWVSDGNLFEIEYGEVGFTPGTGTLIQNITSSPYTFTNLNPQTTYQFYIRRDCGVDDGFSSWIGSSFTTACGIVTSGFYEGFDTTPTGSSSNPTVPQCWSFIDTGGGYGYVNATTPNTSPRNFYMYNGPSSDTGTYILVSPQTDNLGNGTMRVRFWARTTVTTQPATQLDFGILSDNTDPSTFTTIESISLSNVYTEYSVIIPETTNDYFGFLHDLNTRARYIYIDTITYEEIPSCLEVSDLEATNITTNSAELYWTSAGTLFDIEHGETGFTPTGIPTHLGVSNNYILPSLNHSTTYDYYVRQDCGDGDWSTWQGPFTFTTACDIVTGPFYEGFDTTDTGTSTNPTVPQCWSFIDTGGGWGYVNATSPNTAPRNFYMYNGPSSDTGTYILVSPQTDNLGDGTMRVRFWARTTVTTQPATQLDFGTLSDSTDPSTFTTIQSIPLSNVYTEYVIIIPETTDDFFGFRHDLVTRARYVYIDTITYEEIPSCLEVTETEVTSVTFTSAELSWTSSGTLFDIEYGETGFTPTGTPSTGYAGISGTSVTITGLVAETNYQYYIRQDCGDDDLSVWTGPFNFYTGYCIPSVTSTTTLYRITDFSTTNGYINISNEDNGISNSYSDFSDMMVVQSPGGSFDFHISVAANVMVEVWIDLNQDMIFDPDMELLAAFGTGGTAAATTYTGSMLIPVGTPIGEYRFRIRSRYYSGTTATPCGTITNGETEDYTLVIVATPNCLPPIDLGADDISYDSAELFWTLDGGTSFDIEYGEAGFTPTETPSTGLTGVSNPYTLTGLTPETSYEYYVRQNCGGTDGVSIWVGPFSFKTECLPPTITGTTSGSVCGLGEVTLSATTDVGATIAWFDSETGGNKLDEGETFTTPEISETTSYWVAAYTGDGITPGQAKQTFTVANPGGYTLTAGLEFVATEGFTIVSVVAYSYAATGTSIPSVQLQDASGTMLQEVTNVPIPNGGNTGATAVPFTITLNFEVPGPGTYRLMAVGSFSSLARDSGATNAAFPHNVGDAAQITQGILTAASSTSYYFFYDWTIGSGCYSDRTEVIATVTTPPAFELSATETSICEGETTGAVTITTGATDYDTFVWEPLVGVTGDATTGWTFAPTETTTYTLAATQSAGVCGTVATYTVTIDETPDFALNINEADMCINDAPVMLATLPFSITPGTETGCLTAVNNQYPSTTYTPANCDGTVYNITTIAWAGEYSMVNVIEGNVYTFSSSLATDITTISNADGTTAYTAGTGDVHWVATYTGQVRMYTHITDCGSQNTSRTRRVACLIASPVTWSPTTGLYLDAAGTIAYTGTEEFAVYSSSAATTTYTATATSGVCSFEQTVEITVNPIPDAPTGATTQTLDDGDTLADLDVTGSDLVWYADADLTQEIADTTSAVNGTTYYVVSDSACQSAALAITVVIDPCAGITAPTGATEQSLLLGQTIAGLNVSGTNLVWYADADLTIVIPTTTVAVNGTTYYVVSETDECQSDALAITVTVIDPCAEITTPTGDAEQTLDEGDTLADLIVDGDNLAWYADADLTQSLPATTIAQNGVTYYVASVTDICQSEPLAITVTIAGMNPCEDVTVPAPTGEEIQTLTEGQTLADLIVEGENLQWYADADLTQSLEETHVAEETTYYVTQTIGVCTGEALAVTVQFTVGREDFESFAFRFYPNPVGDVLNLTSNVEITQIDLFNMLGQKVNVFTNANNTQVDMSGLPTGNYIISITIEGITKTFKVVKN